MPLKLFELVGADATRPFSPYCWRTRMALAHKGLSAETIPWCFTEKDAIAPHQSEKVPVLLDDDKAVVDFLGHRKLSRRQLFGPAVAVRWRGGPRHGPDAELVG